MIPKIIEVIEYIFIFGLCKFFFPMINNRIPIINIMKFETSQITKILYSGIFFATLKVKISTIMNKKKADLENKNENKDDFDF